MKKIAIVGSNKVTLSMFVDFFHSIYDADAFTCDLNILYGESVISDLIVASVEKALSPHVLLKFKTKRTTPDEAALKKLSGAADYVLKFDLSSYEPEVLLQAEESFLPPIMERWKKNVELLSKI